MRIRHLALILFLVPVFVYQAASTEPQAALLFSQEGVKAQPKDKGKDKEKDKKPAEKKLTDTPDTDVFTQTPAPLRDALGFNPHMMGDFYGTFAKSFVTVTGVQTTTVTTQRRDPALGTLVVTTTSTATPVTQQRTFLIPLAGRGAFKIAENASPMPVDRCFFTYNHFNSIRSPQYGQTDPSSTATQTTVNNPQQGVRTTSNVVTTFPTPYVPFVNLNREVAGFEKTFLGGRASIEMRLPLFQQPGSTDDFRAAGFGDITVLGKYAFYLNRETGDVFSGGLAVTAPTGAPIPTIEGPVNSTLLQPWIGYIWNFDAFYLQVFHSAVVPTDARDVTLLFNDFGLGYWMYRGGADRALRFIVPTVEVHVTTPLNNRSENAPISCPDLVVMTGGAHFGLFRNCVLSLGVGAPVSGPYTYGVEAFVQFNRRF